MTNPTTQEGEDFETIVGLANPTKVEPKQQPEPAEHEVTPVKGAYPYDAPRPDAKSQTHASHRRVGGAYPYDVPNPSAQAKDDTTAKADKDGGDKQDEGAYPYDNETD
ncbi:hypothetical protein ACFQ1S_28970 [Kibdelosporangium lantanae]|uniref:Uncharacterized protein n=1 Tax=Kibdelosporangium lantanae TaxID=1497396 RepID=A0ABW3MJ88_9PSEU